MSEQLYQKRIPIYPRSVKGRFRTIKYSILFVAYGVYFLLPWLRWQRDIGPEQAILFDIVGRRFYLFDLVVYAQDIFWLAGLLGIGAFLLFFVTGIAGRVFCGYFCFQTLWTDVFILIERLAQGERNARIKLAAAPWSVNKATRMGLTWLLWLLVAFLTGLSFTLYWGDAFTLVKAFFSGAAPFPAYATTLFLTATTFVMAGLAREQTCTYMCPYARFQGAMFDQDTMTVAYDEKRGERGAGRHKPEKGLLTQAERQRQNVGDCIDCGYCVQVCPMGIDIRNGMQYQCTSCALCIDACNTIMDSINYPRGLIRYASEHSLQGGKVRWLKGKTVGYGVFLIAICALLVWSIATRSLVELSVSPIRQPLYVVLSDGRILNRYEIKINNKTSQPRQYQLSIEGLPGAELEFVQGNPVHVHAESSSVVLARVTMQRGSHSEARVPLTFVLRDMTDSTQTTLRHTSVFSLPQN
ncbi:MAG: cytochrome c oxidase accessory protein CcoG [Gammaproteobacteria bacterium]